MSLSKLVFPKYRSREVETLTLSFFYPNNVLLSFLNNYDSIRFPSNACPCGNGIQDASHILLHCLIINNSHHSKFETFIKENPFHSVELLSDQQKIFFFPGLDYLASWKLVDNYRPVSVIPIFGKIFEKVI